jgi:hypothetical protein
MSRIDYVSSRPGDLRKVRGIPYAITDDHNEVFYYWADSGLRGATLIHIDGHADMDSVFIPPECIDDFRPYFWEVLTVTGFICSAIYYGIVSDVYWLNPHSQERRLQDMGSSRKEEGSDRILLEPRKEKGHKLLWNHPVYWESEDGKGHIITPEQLVLQEENPLIIDVDYDAFSGKYIQNVPDSYDGTAGYQTRMGETFEFLSGLGRRPDLITATRSKGGKRFDNGRIDLEEGLTHNYTPPEHIDPIERSLIRRFRALYRE